MGDSLLIVGGGLAGCEAAWQAAEHGLRVTLYEMRPARTTPAHQTDLLAELVGSNSLKSATADCAPGLLKEEMAMLESLVLRCARQAALPAGDALAVDRAIFARAVTEAISSHPRIEVVRQEIVRLPDLTAIIATGPLTSPSLAAELSLLTGRKHLYFFDACSAVVSADSLDMSTVFEGSRRPAASTDSGGPSRAVESGEGEEPCLNCPLTEEHYDGFYTALLSAEQLPLPPFERGAHFEAHLPIEEIARRGRLSLARGPMRAVGLIDPRTGEQPFAVVQLRPENRERTAFSLVGFQTALTAAEQERVFRLIPGLERARFLRYGQVHRSIYLNAAGVLDEFLRLRARLNLFCAGQLVGVEGYLEACLTGLLCGINAPRILQGGQPVLPPPETMSGALLRYLQQTAPKDFQPTNANYGLLPPVPLPAAAAEESGPPEAPRKDAKQERRLAHRSRALAAMQDFLPLLTNERR